MSKMDNLIAERSDFFTYNNHVILGNNLKLKLLGLF